MWDSRKSLLVMQPGGTLSICKDVVADGGDVDVRMVSSADELLLMAEQWLPDAILLDWNMPVMDGLEFLINLRQLPNGGSPKVLFCTTETDVKHITKAMQAGADEYIMKPFNKQIVKSKFEEVGLC